MLGCEIIMVAKLLLGWERWIFYFIRFFKFIIAIIMCLGISLWADKNCGGASGRCGIKLSLWDCKNVIRMKKILSNDI